MNDMGGNSTMVCARPYTMVFIWCKKFYNRCTKLYLSCRSKSVSNFEGCRKLQQNVILSCYSFPFFSDSVFLSWACVIKGDTLLNLYNSVNTLCVKFKEGKEKENYNIKEFLKWIISWLIDGNVIGISRHVI